MITQDLYSRILQANQGLLKWKLIMINFGVAAMAILIYLNLGFDYWILILGAVLVIVNLQPKRAQKAIQILMERSSEIEYIEIEKNNGEIELDIKLSNDFKEYEIKLPIKEGDEILSELKIQLPNIKFRYEKDFS